MRIDWIGWAFAATHAGGEQLGQGEKLVLVYLAAQVGADGCALLDRAKLGMVTGYEPRSLQRHLKTLRDSKLLQDLPGSWYALGVADVAEAPLEEVPARIQTPPQARILAQEDLEAAGETIANHVSEAGDRLLVRLNDSTLRLLGGIERLVRELDQVPAPAPPPDPVLATPLYAALLEQGIPQEQAYAAARSLMERATTGHQDGSAGGNPRVPERSGREGSSTAGEAPASVGTRTAAAGAALIPDELYADNPGGRFSRVWQILHLHPPTEEAVQQLLPVWQDLEEAENKHSVPGETPAFELLYPAIVTAARRNANRMPMREFLDPKAIAAGRAPWDQAVPAAGALSERLMQTETSRMLQLIERAGHPQCQVGPPATETEGGRTLTESTHSYYLRVKRVYEQLQRLQQMTQE